MKILKNMAIFIKKYFKKIKRSFINFTFRFKILKNRLINIDK